MLWRKPNVDSDLARVAFELDQEEAIGDVDEQLNKKRNRSRPDSAPRNGLGPSTPHLSNRSWAKGRSRPEVVGDWDPLTPNIQTQPGTLAGRAAPTTA